MSVEKVELATLENGALPLGQLPASLVSAAAAPPAQSLLVATGAGRAVTSLAIGTTGQTVMVRSDGTLQQLSPAVIEMSAWKAVGDGATDNTTLIKEALATATAKITGTGEAVTLRFGKGIYLTGPQEVPQRCGLEGIGMGTTLKLKATSTGALLTNEQGSTLSAQGCSFRRMRLNGNKANQSAGAWNCGIVLRNKEGAEPWEYEEGFHTVEEVFAEEFAGDGFVQAGYGGTRMSNCVAWVCDGFGFNLNQDSVYSNCIAAACGIDGFLVQNGSNHLSNCKAYFSGRKLVESRTKSKELEVAGPSVNVWDGSGLTSKLKFKLANGWGNGFAFINISETTTVEGNFGGGTYVGCCAQDNARAGFYIRGSRHSFLGCEADSNNNNGTSTGAAGGTPVGEYAGWDLAEAEQCHISGVSWTRGANLNQQAAAAHIASGSIENILSLVVSTHGSAANVGGTANMPLFTAGSETEQNSILFNGEGATRSGINSGELPTANELVPDPLSTGTYMMTLTGNTTVAAPKIAGENTRAGIYYYPGMKLRFVFTQDATGGRTLTWNAAFEVNIGEGSRAPKERTTYEFIYNGTKWVQIGTPGIIARGIVKLSAGKATVKVAAATTTSLILTDAIGATLANDSVGVIERKTGEFVLETLSKTGEPEVVWALIG